MKTLPRKLALGCVLSALLASLPARALEILIPAYFYPSADASQSFWTGLTAAASAGVSVTAIMNPNNGPGDRQNDDYVQAVSAFRAAGGKVLGYVFTCYGRNLCVDGQPATRSTGDVLADAQRYAQWYAVDGIFLDEMSPRLDELGFYTTVAQGLRTAQPQWRIVGNPGNAAPVEYLAVADTLVTYEGDASYATAATEPWMTQPSGTRQAHMIYNVSGEAAMRAALAAALQRHAGFVYITDDRYVPGDPTQPNPWDQLASYWTAEVQAVSAVPEPASWALALAGAAALLVHSRRQRRRL
jgi:MYXO-CTERM domain-containing protein